MEIDCYESQATNTAQSNSSVFFMDFLIAVDIQQYSSQFRSIHFLIKKNYLTWNKMQFLNNKQKTK